MIKRIAAFLIAWLCLAGLAHAAPSHVQDCGQSTYGTTGAASCTLGSSVTANDFLWACIRTGSGTLTSVTDNQGDTWHAAATLQTGPGAAVYWTIAKGGSTTTSLAVPSGGGSIFNSLQVVDFSGMGLAPTQDGTFADTNFASGQTTIKTGTLSTSGAANELILGCGSVETGAQTPSSLTDYGAGGGTPTAFASNPIQTSGGTVQNLVSAYQLSGATTGPWGFQWTVTSNSTAGIITAFIPTPANTCQAIGPNGTAALGICQYCPVSLAALALYPVPASQTCTAVVTTGVSSCPSGSAPSGSGSVDCTVCTNGSAWVGC